MEISPAGSTGWSPARADQILRPFDRLRSGANSRGALLWSDKSVVPFGASTELEILPPHADGAQSGLHLLRGIVSFFHRDQPGRIRIITRGAVAGVEGTEFVLAVNDADLTTLSVVDGRVKIGNDFGALSLTNGEAATVEPGQAPVRTAGFIANNLLQWCFYYPAVLDPDDVQLTADEQKDLAPSLADYRAGDLPAALAQYPTNRPDASDNERVYHAALLLAVGEVAQTESILSSISGQSERPRRLADALRELIAAVKRQPSPSNLNPRLSTEFLAASYSEQSRAVRETSLENALRLAQRAATNSPQFGFAWERVAELQFSFGRTREAADVLDKSLALAPRDAQGLALRGFLLAAQNQPRAAIREFDRALAVDSALGNAWLGRGLCRIRVGDDRGGREDLLLAAALEPQRAGLRSYLGKSYADAGDFPHATHELQLAKTLDPRDPTAWLYSALVNQRENRVNDAIRDLEKSESLNDNRSVYRSQVLLDQDRAVRSANLANVYRDAGMFDVSLREAARAVNYDYANYSAHLFLANSYFQFLNPNDFSTRYETPANVEYFVANLLAPVNAGPLSPTISQGEYSRLFEQNRLGVVSSTEYLSRGAWSESGAQFGTCGNFNYDLEAVYLSDPGQRLNNDFQQRLIDIALKQQITSKDTLYEMVQQSDFVSGETSQYYDPGMANPSFREHETQTPIVLLGYHHEWQPGVHTLLFASRINDNLEFNNGATPLFMEWMPPLPPFDPAGVPTLTSVYGLTANEQYNARQTLYSAELQQILKKAEHTTVVGTRFQYGHFVTADMEDQVYLFPPLFDTPAVNQDLTTMFQRVSVYGYHQWQIFDPLQLIGGVAYDRITFPENFSYAPISPNDKTEDQISPKAGMIWTPLDKTTVRFAYTRSLSGASLDQSIQIEPAQVAGFIQDYRSIIPESIAGPTSGAQIETFDLSLEQKFDTGTYLGLSGEILNSTVDRTVGTYIYYPTILLHSVPASTRENLDYQEKTLQFTANQLVGRDWSFGAVYRVSEAVLNDNFVDLPDENQLPFFPFVGYNNFQPRLRTRGTLQSVDLTAIYNLPCGFFAKGEALWFDQSNGGYGNIPSGNTVAEPGDDFWQFNLFAGYRFLHRKAEASLGLLNVAGQDYRLNPLNIYNELPRARTLAVRFQIDF